MGKDINIINLNIKYKLNESFLRKIIDDVLKNIKKSNKAELEVVFLDDKSIRRLNKKYKKKDRATDVLAFRLDRQEFGDKKFLGSIFISVDKAVSNSKRFGTSPQEELVLYVIHGILHLFGYDDGASDEMRGMRKKEAEILNGLCRNLSRVLTPR